MIDEIRSGKNTGEQYATMRLKIYAVFRDKSRGDGGAGRQRLGLTRACCRKCGSLRGVSS